MIIYHSEISPKSPIKDWETVDFYCDLRKDINGRFVLSEIAVEIGFIAGRWFARTRRFSGEPDYAPDHPIAESYDEAMRWVIAFSNERCQSVNAPDNTPVVHFYF